MLIIFKFLLVNGGFINLVLNYMGENIGLLVDIWLLGDWISIPLRSTKIFLLRINSLTVLSPIFCSFDFSYRTDFYFLKSLFNESWALLKPMKFWLIGPVWVSFCIDLPNVRSSIVFNMSFKLDVTSYSFIDIGDVLHLFLSI